MFFVDFVIEERIDDIVLFDIEIESYCNVHYNIEGLCCKGS